VEWVLKEVAMIQSLADTCTNSAVTAQQWAHRNPSQSFKLQCWPPIKVGSQYFFSFHEQTFLKCCFLFILINRWTTRQRTLFHRIGTDPVVAVFTRIVDGQIVPELYFVDGRWLGV
jgi:hypothetical protein